MSYAVYLKINRLIYVVFVPLLICVTLVALLLMKLFGSKYGIDGLTLLIFGFLGTIQIVSAIYYSVILTFSKDIYRRYLLFSTFINIFIVIIYVILVATSRISIQYIAMALILNYLLIIFLQRSLIKSQLCGNVDTNS